MKIDIKDPNNWITRDIFESYCGHNSEKILGFYDKAAEKRNMMSMSFNLLAILLLPAWLGYRKQWVLLSIITILFAVLPFVEAIFNFSLPNSGFTGAFIVIGLMSNGFLLSNAHGAFMKLKQSGMSEDEIKNELKDKASPSVPMAFATVAVYIIILFGSTYIAHILFGLPNSELLTP